MMPESFILLDFLHQNYAGETYKLQADFEQFVYL